MLQGIVIGYLGGDAEIKTSDGREFTTFRVAHTDRWKDTNGQTKETTQWVDCVMDGKPAVVDYLKRGTLVYVQGHLKSRIYSSAKDRCMKAGVTITARSIELLGGKTESVPSQVVDNDGMLHNVTKWYHCPDFVRPNFQPEVIQVMHPRGNEVYNVDRKGFIFPLAQQSDAIQQAQANNNKQANGDSAEVY